MFKKPERKFLLEPPPQGKPGKILYRPLVEKTSAGTPPSPSFSSKKNLTTSAAAIDDLLDTDKSLPPVWKSVLSLFPNLDKFDHKSITSYNIPEINQKCSVAFAFFEKVITALSPSASSLSSKSLKEDLLKVFVVCFQHVTQLLLGLVSEEVAMPAEEPLKNLETLSNFLILALQDRKNPAILAQHDVTLLQIIRETLNVAHERLANLSKVKNISLVAYFLYYQFQTLAVLAALNEGRNFMKTAAYDSIKLAFETFERSLRVSFNHPLLKEVYGFQMGKDETWVKTDHVKVAAAFGKKKFSVIQLAHNADYPRFSIRYVNLYYMLKILQLLVLKKNPALEERVLEVVARLLKDTSEVLTMKTLNKTFPLGDDILDVEIALNENLVCFNIIKRILPNVDDPFAVIEKWGYTQFLKSLMESHIALALRFKLVAFANLDKVKSDPLDTIVAGISYKTMHDYIAGVFNFLSRLKNAKDSGTSKTPRGTIRTSKASILTLIEELVGEIIGGIDTVQGYEEELRMLKAYIVEYLFDNRHIVSRQAAEHIIRLVESKAFHFTSPKSLKALSQPSTEEETIECSLERLTNKRIVSVLNEIMTYDKIWAETILQHLMGQVKNLIDKEEGLFGLYKLLYCALTGEVHDNCSFFEKLFVHLVKGMDYKTYAEYESKGESKAIKAFVDIKGINEFIGILQTLYKSQAMRSKEVVKMTEKLFLELVHIPAISEQLLRYPSVVIEFLEYTAVYSHMKEVAISLFRQLLACTKYNPKTIASANDKTNYLPLALIDFIKKGRKGYSVANAIPFMELLANFVTRESGAPTITPHQVVLNSSMSVEFLFQVLSTNSTDPSIGQMLGLFLKFLGGLQAHNDSVAAEISNSPLIAKKGLYAFIKDGIIKGVLKAKEIETTLQLFLEIIFEASIVDLSTPGRFLVKRLFFLLVYLSILLFLAKYPEWKKIVGIHCQFLCKSIEGSYWNYSVCARTRIFKRFLKMTKNYVQDPSTLKALITLCTNTACTSISSQCLKKFIGQLNVPFENISLYSPLLTSTLDSLALFLSLESPREVFVFSGKPNSGIGLLTKKTLPKEGFCFCGSIRVERKDQSKDHMNEKMTIFKLGSSKEKEIELFLQDGYLNYYLGDIRGKEQAYLVTFSQKRLEEDKWYFIELYHLNNSSDSSKSLSLYIDSELVREAPCKTYHHKLDYDENTIGCGVQLEYVGKQGEEKLKNNFRGEMTALYFIEVSQKTLPQVRSFLSYILNNVPLENVVHYLALSQDPRKGKTFDVGIVEKMFMHINPKYTGRLAQSKQLIYALQKGGKTIEVYNSVERVYQETKIDHNTIAKDVFLNIGGIKTVLPLFYELIQSENSFM